MLRSRRGGAAGEEGGARAGGRGEEGWGRVNLLGGRRPLEEPKVSSSATLDPPAPNVCTGRCLSGGLRVLVSRPGFGDAGALSWVALGPSGSSIASFTTRTL